MLATVVAVASVAFTLAMLAVAATTRELRAR
jgi:hypothetical protein